MIELVAGSRIARELATGCARITGALVVDEICELLVQTATHQLRLPARVVATDGADAEVQLLGFDAALAAEIAALEQTALPDEGISISFSPAPSDAPDELLELAPVEEPEASEEACLDLADELPVDDGGPDAPEGRRTIARNLHERLRGLTLAQQIKKALSPDPSERMMLERMYGKNVWEALLRNPRLTPPEVARIARMGMLPRVMIEVIVGNGAWLQVPEVRRALLTNPRLGTDQILRVLRLLPKHELKLASVQTAYPMTVRDAAKRMLRSTPA